MSDEVIDTRLLLPQLGGFYGSVAAIGTLGTSIALTATAFVVGLLFVPPRGRGKGKDFLINFEATLWEISRMFGVDPGISDVQPKGHRPGRHCL